MSSHVTVVSPGPHIIDNKEYASCVPIKALHLLNGNHYYVYLVSTKDTALGNETVAQKLEVEIEDQDEKYAALNAGLSDNQFVIVSTSKPIKDGDRVHLKENNLQ